MMHSLLNVGRKMIDINLWQPDRSAKFRDLGSSKTFENCFKYCWNNFATDELRKKFLDEENGPKLLKDYLKSQREINIDVDNVKNYLKFTGPKSFEVLKRGML